jgi:DNA-directed RNA polymerase specialized sigma subunit
LCEDLSTFLKEAMADAPDLRETQRKELDLWKKWKDNGQKPEDLKPLMQSFKPVIRKQANAWASRADLPPQAVHAAFQKQFVQALQTYDPDKGAKLGSWVTTNLHHGKAQRWISTYQDPLRVQENRYYKMGMWDNAFANLKDQLGREPSTREIAEHLGWSESETGRMEAEKRKTVFGSSSGFDPTAVTPSKESDALKMVRYNLNPQELQVFDYLGGYYGKPQLRPGEIAKKLNLNPSKVTRIKNAISKKLGEYLEE